MLHFYFFTLILYNQRVREERLMCVIDLESLNMVTDNTIEMMVRQGMRLERLTVRRI